MKILTLFLLFGLPFIFQERLLAQCDPSTPYDKIVSGYHSSIALENDGVFSVWGEGMANNGTANVLSPLIINATNFPLLTGTPLKATIGGIGSGGFDQAVLLTTTGLFAWGQEGELINNSLTLSSTFNKVTGLTNGDPTYFGLPIGVTPAQVKVLFGTYLTLSILTTDGFVWMLTSNTALQGDGSALSATTWHKVKTDTSTYLSGIVDIRGQVTGSSATSNGAFMAVKSDGTVFAWGTNAFLSGGGGGITKNYATLMPIPSEFNASNVPKMIGVTGGTGLNNTLYILSKSGTLYSVGAGGSRQTGDFTTIDRTSWVKAQKSATANDFFTDIDFISTQEHTAKYPAIAVITKTGGLYAWGSNNGLMIGQAIATTYDPSIPLGFNPGDKAVNTEMGGHTLMVLKTGSDRFCYVGHRISGSMGDGTATSTNEASFNCTATPVIPLCTSVPVSADLTLSTIAASPTSIIANGTSTSTITVQLKDLNGNNLTTSGGIVVIFTTAGTISGVTDNNNGTYTAILTSSLIVTTATISYTLIGAAGTNTAAVSFTCPPNTIFLSSAIGTNTQTLCINSAITNITFTTSGATGIGTPTGLPAGVTAAFDSNTITIAGTPTASGTFNYTIPLTGGCGNVNATGTIIVTADNTVGTASSSPTVCINSAIPNITHATTGATGIGIATGLPAGVTAAFDSNTITIAGTPTASGTFNYTIPLTGGCGNINATGTIIVTADNTVGTASSSPTVCIYSAIPNITHSTTVATGIGIPTGLPAGVTAAFDSNTITIAGTPTASGTFNYTIPLTGGCGNVNATGTIIVTADNTVGAASSSPTVCINSAIPNITHATTGATGIGIPTGLPAGVTASFDSNTLTISGTPTERGTFNYTIPLTGGCGNINATGTMVVNSVVASVSIESSDADNSICTATSITFSANPTNGGVTPTYQWKVGNDNVLGATNSTYTTSSLPNNSEISVVMTSNATCVTGSPATSNIITITVNPLPTPTITPSGATTFCNGGSVTLTAVNATNYLWSTGATSQSISVTSSGSYSVTGTNANGCSATSIPTVVTVNPLPSPTITPDGPTTFCNGGSVTLTAATATNYLWSTGATSQSITVTSSGSYSVTVTNANGCSATSTPTVVTVNPLPSPTITPDGPTTFCNGGSVTLTASTATNYLWSTGATSQSITVTSSGSYSVTVTNANGCSASSTPTVVTVNPLPSSKITPSGPTTVCNGGSVTLTAANATSYLWNTGATSQSITVTSSGSYSVTVTNANGCSATSSTPTVVSVNPLPSPTITPDGPTTFCNGGSVTLTAANATNYLWSTGATSQSITVATAGSYSVTVTNANGCSATSTPTLVTVYPLPLPSITPDGPTTFCNGGSVTLTAANATNYLWSTGATSQSITVTSSGSYSVSVTNANGCSASSTPTVVTVNPLPTPIIEPSGATTVCSGGSATLTATTATNYLWSTGATSQIISVTTSGSYSVTVTNANGCSASSTPTVVTLVPLPTPTIEPGGPISFCNGGSATLTAANATNYLWSTGATSQSITVTTAGAYSVTVTNADGCSASSTPTVVTVYPLPTPTITPGGPTSFCKGGLVALTAATATSYLWNTGATSQSIIVNTAGAYSVTVTNANGCSKSNTTIIPVNPLPDIPVVNNMAYCQNDPSSPLQAIPTDSNAIRWYRFPSGGVAIPTPNSNTLLPSVDTFYATQTTIFGCESPRVAMTVTIHPIPADSILNPTQNFICDGSFLQLNASNNYTYQWLNNGLPIAGDSSNNYSAHLGGIYSFQMTNQYGCINNSSNSISIQLIKKPAADFSFDNRCKNTPIQFTNTSNIANSGTIIWDWNFGNGSIGNLKDEQSIYQSIGKYTVTLSATPSSCPLLVDSIKKDLTIEVPVPGIHYGAVNAKATMPYWLSARNFGIAYLWNPFTGLSNPSIQNPTTTLNAEQVYTIRITNNSGCLTQDTVLVRVFNDYGVYVPSGFSPDGDGVNDKLTPILIGIREVKSFRIYNRWGQLLYQTSDKNAGWNGTYKGKPQVSETYVWVLVVITEEGKTILKTGKSTLIR